MAPNVVVASVLLVIAFGLYVDGHTLYRRDVDELLDLKHDHDDADVTTTPSSQQDNVSNAPLMKEETVGYSLIQHNNPYWPGEKRSRQAFKAPVNGVCNPDQVNIHSNQYQLKFSRHNPSVTLTQTKLQFCNQTFNGKKNSSLSAVA